ncbi:MAG: phosphate/phosphite/phosphonate ABC transporter substrate-binding protein [Acidobacteria bacterium]|nr:phosphate/phosphite/phosphonate ABC transporter substrate-binding protein [Acidobacteriota bacterium]
MRLRASCLGAVAAVLLAGAALAGSPVEEPLRLGVVSFYNPRLMYLKYQPLVDYLTQRTGRRWELTISGSYDATVADLCSGRLAVAYLGPFTYVRAQRACGATPVVQLQTHGQPTYRAQILVRADSPISSIAELRGRSFGFGAPLSTSSHVVPRGMLEAAGLRAGTDVRCRYYGHHERAARAVLLGEVDACGVRDIVGTKFAGRGLRLLAVSDPIPNFPLVVGPTASVGLRRDLVRVLVEEPAVDPAARRTVAGWDEELAGGFALPTENVFDQVRATAIRILGPRALFAPEAELECGAGDR